MAISKITSDAIDATNFNLDSDTLTIDATNNRVGIGTSSPDKNLELASSGDTTLRITDTRNTTYTIGDSKGAVEFYWEDGSGSFPAIASSINCFTADTFGSAGGLNFKTHNGSNLSTRMTLDQNGNVGIGTSSPDTLLNLESAAPTVRLAPTTQNNSSGIELGVLNAGTNAYAKIDVTNTVTYDTNIRFFTNTSGSTTQVERMRILHGGGLTFNGDSAQANALDDYEEGTWTPTLSGTATALFGVFHASYLKIGRKVTAQAYIQFASDSDGSPVKITMPFNSHNVTNGWQAGVIAYNTGFTGDHIIIQPNSNILEIRRGSGGNQRLYSEYSQNYIIFGITYITA